MRQGTMGHKLGRFAITLCAAALGVGALMAGVGHFLKGQTDVEVRWSSPAACTAVKARLTDASAQAGWRKDLVRVTPLAGGWQETDAVGITLAVQATEAAGAVSLRWQEPDGAPLMSRTVLLEEAPPGCRVVLQQRVTHEGALARFAASVMGADASAARAFMLDLDASFSR
jgi:hypothetical protein